MPDFPDLPDRSQLFSPAWWQGHLTILTDWSLTAGLRILLILIALVIVTRVAKFFVAKSIRLAIRTHGNSPIQALMVTKRQNTLIRLFEAVATITLGLIAIVMIFDELGFAVGPLLASAGIVGVAVGFGAQSLVKDIISGAFIIMESQYSVGDVVKVDQMSGAVEEINLRTTVLRDVDGGVHIIPNGEITRVTVLTRDWSRLVLDLGIAYDSDIPRATEVLQTVFNDYALEHAATVLEPPEVLGIQDLADNSVLLRVWMKMLPGTQWAAGRELRARVKTAFDQAGIEIPFPQRTLWVRNESDK